MDKNSLGGTLRDDNPQNAWRVFLPAERLFWKKKYSFRGKKKKEKEKRKQKGRLWVKKLKKKAEGVSSPLSYLAL